jgi:hypothetical protein
VSQRTIGVAFVLAVAAAVEAAAVFYMLSDPDVPFPSLADLRAAGLPPLLATAIPLAVIIFLHVTKPGGAFMRGLRKNDSN